MDDEGGPVTMSYGRRESFVLADDMTDFFGSQRSVDGKPLQTGVDALHSGVQLLLGLILQQLFCMASQFPKAALLWSIP